MGHYQASHVAWYETMMLHCALCGKIIPGDIWVAEIEGQPQFFCTPDCERLYIEYWLPKYGARQAHPENEIEGAGT